MAQTVTIRDVARRAGVSVTTVSRVISHSPEVAPATRERVERAVAELRFVVNAHARALNGVSRSTVACLVTDMVNTSFAALAAGIEAEATAGGHLFMLSTTHGDLEQERALVDVLVQQRAQAVIFAGAAVLDDGYRARVEEHAGVLSRTGARLVLCGRPSLDGRADIGWAGYDDAGGAAAVTEHLIELGHHRILVVGNNGASTADARIRGHYRALREAGLPVDLALAPRSGFSSDDGYASVRGALAAGIRFTAVFGLADHLAVGALRALREEGLRVPQDVSVVGFDDAPFVRDLTPPLTSVRVDFAAVGRRAAQVALGTAAGAAFGGGNEFPATLVVRESTAPVKGREAQPLHA